MIEAVVAVIMLVLIAYTVREARRTRRRDEETIAHVEAVTDRVEARSRAAETEEWKTWH